MPLYVDLYPPIIVPSILQLEICFIFHIPCYIVLTTHPSRKQILHRQVLQGAERPPQHRRLDLDDAEAKRRPLTHSLRNMQERDPLLLHQQIARIPRLRAHGERPKFRPDAQVAALD